MDEWYPDPYEWPEDPYPFHHKEEEEDDTVCGSCGFPVLECECMTYEQ